MTGRAFFPIFMRHAHSESPSICMGVTQGDSPKSLCDKMQLRRRSEGLECKAFCELDMDDVPKYPIFYCACAYRNATHLVQTVKPQGPQGPQRYAENDQDWSSPAYFSVLCVCMSRRKLRAQR
jgi:hypothetical protein